MTRCVSAHFVLAAPPHPLAGKGGISDSSISADNEMLYACLGFSLEAVNRGGPVVSDFLNTMHRQFLCFLLAWKITQYFWGLFISDLIHTDIVSPEKKVSSVNLELTFLALRK